MFEKIKNMEINAIESRMTEQDKKWLKTVFSPIVVGVQPEDSRRNLCVLKDGEIRYYGEKDKPHPSKKGTPVYISSNDGGRTWKEYEVGKCLGSSVYLPWCDKYVTVMSDLLGARTGTYARISHIGPDDENYKEIKITDKVFWNFMQPKVMKDSHRIFVSCDYFDGSTGDYIAVFMYSDDDGESWEYKMMKSTERYVPTWPSVDDRWNNNGSEPTVTELADGSLWMLARTSLGYYYSYFSYDKGESWTNATQSPFHATLTTPCFYELSDGRLLLFWNNCEPLPETRHGFTLHGKPKDFHFADEEDVFTNRDACHVAIMGKDGTWKGFRELALADIRNQPDYRYNGGFVSSGDKSVQQFQALELPYGKVLVAYGQHVALRRLAIFDVDWLLEDFREEDFTDGLKNVSTQMFVKSWSGCNLYLGKSGHSAWNRTNGALLVPDPDELFRETLQICRIHDERLVSEKQGVVWNFPMSKKGRVDIEFRIDGAGVRVSLTDRWFQPVDENAYDEAIFAFALTEKFIEKGKWHNLAVCYDVEQGIAQMFVNENFVCNIKLRNQPSFGISYLHVQTCAEKEDFKGTLIRKIKMKELK